MSFLVPVAANVPNLRTSDLRARKKAGRDKLSEVSNKDVSSIHIGYNTVEFGQKTSEGMSLNSRISRRVAKCHFVSNYPNPCTHWTEKFLYILILTYKFTLQLKRY